MIKIYIARNKFLMRDCRDFVKKYQGEFQFAHAYVKRCEDELRDIRAGFYEMQGSRYEAHEALCRLDDALASASESSGKIISSTALRRKHYDGN